MIIKETSIGSPGVIWKSGVLPVYGMYIVGEGEEWSLKKYTTFSYLTISEILALRNDDTRRAEHYAFVGVSNTPNKEKALFYLQIKST